MINELILKWIAGILLSVICFGGIYAVEQHIEKRGYDRAIEECKVRLDAYEKKINKQIDTIEATANTLVVESRENSQLLAKDISTIIKGQKGKTLTVIKDGGCTPSQTFSDTFNSINKRINENMKDKVK